MLSKNLLRSIIDFYGLKNHFNQIIPIQTGHINDSFCLSSSVDIGSKYFLQKLNLHVFQKPFDILDNYLLVQQVFDTDNQSKYSIPKIVSNNQKNYFFIDENGNYWRLFEFLINYQSVSNNLSQDNIYQSGSAFGYFINNLSPFSAAKFKSILPEFHNLKQRLLFLQNSLKVNYQNRILTCNHLFEIVRKLEKEMVLIQTLIDTNKIPLRVCHNDTKSSNVMIHNTDQKICIIDLDTVQVSSLLFDFGDGIRSLISSLKEDEIDKTNTLQIENFRSFSSGFLENTSSIIEGIEKQMLVNSCVLLPFLMGIRFLTDYLNGDTYFKVKHDTHNLERATNQLHLASSIHKNKSILQQILNHI